MLTGYRLFDAAEVSSLVLATIELLQYDHNTFSLATGRLLFWCSRWLRGFADILVGAKLTLDQVPGGLAGAGKIDAVLTEAVLYYTV